MDYYCDVSDKTINFKFIYKHLQSLTHTEFEECIRIRHTIKQTDWFDIDEILTIISITTLKNSIFISFSMILI